MASAFDKLKKNSKLKSGWKNARKAEGFQSLQSAVGNYKGKLKIVPDEITKGTLAGCPVIRMVCTVVEPDECAGQSNTKDYIFGDDADRTLESLARDMKFMFPAAKDDIAKASFEEIIGMLEDLKDDLHDCDFEVATYTPKQGKSKGVPKKILNIGVVTVAEGEDDDEDEDEDEEDEDEKPVKKSSKKDSKPADDDDDDDEDDDDEDSDDDAEDEDDDEEDEDEYVPSKGDLVKYGRSTCKVTAIQTKAKTATIKNIKTDSISKGIAWSKLTPVEED